jgi:hypothetical protein
LESRDIHIYASLYWVDGWQSLMYLVNAGSLFKATGGWWMLITKAGIGQHGIPRFLLKGGSGEGR